MRERPLGSKGTLTLVGGRGEVTVEMSILSAEASATSRSRGGG